ncbi:hypothetical protein BVY03_02105 [bacterium K02(2017)]|nr:hypothetical protein BVY03_02105 [bacterium K02(2017)]
MKTALAIFVKTPGLSPVKTRLAKTIGQKSAEEFYKLSLNAVKELTAKVQRISENSIEPIWAVAEHEGVTSPYWDSFNKVSQGDGDLGLRLHTIYSKLLKNYNQVVLMGADSPQLLPEQIINGVNKINHKNFIIGPTYDGGFYFFGGNKAIKKELWLDVKYSHDTTCFDLSQRLNDESHVVMLPKDYDVDVYADLQKVKPLLELRSLDSQKQLLSWINISISKG